MREFIELQTGQVAFLSGLLAGFSLTVAANVVQLDMRKLMPRVCLVLLTLSTLLFLIALYVDVRLTIELANVESLQGQALEYVARVRTIGTTSATLALIVFVSAIGALGWLAGWLTGVFSTLLAAGTMGVLVYIWLQVATLQTFIPG